VNGEVATLAAPRWRQYLPDPGRGWVRFAPAVWPAAESWVDVPGERWGSSGGRVAFPAEPEPPAGDVLWLPPVPAPRAKERDEWAAARAAEGTPVVTQLFPGERPPAGCIAAYDLSETVIAGQVLSAADFPAAGASVAIAVWPLLPGIAPAPAALRRAFETLAGAGLRALLVVRPELRPADRRILAARVAEERYGAVFHGEAGSRRAIAREARPRGLEPFPRRPPLAVADPLAANRRVAEVFGLLGELWSRLGMTAEPAQAFFSAMRAADRLPQSLVRLREESNLGVLPWLDEARRRIVEDVLATGRSALCDELLARYAGEAPR
jgi:hypothetical protein